MDNYEYILKTEHISKRFGSLEVLKDINLSVKKGEVMCIIGPSGAGKSTYLRSLNELEMITSGKIFIKDELFLHRENDKTIEKIDPIKQKEMLLEMGMVFQRFNLFPHLSVLDNVMLAPVRVRKIDKEEARVTALDLLERVGLSDKADEFPARLSGGQQQRVAIARALAMQPEIMLFDEPTSALDPISTSHIEDLALELKDRYTIVIVTHNMQQAARISDKTAFFLLGEIIEYNDTTELFSRPQNKKTEEYITGRFG